MKFAIDHSSDAAFWMGSDGHLVYVNDAACACVGYTRDELLSMSVQDLDADLSADRWQAFWQKLRQDHTLRFETRHRTKDGRVIPVELRTNYLEFRGEEYNCAFVRTVTNRKTGREEAGSEPESSRLVPEDDQETQDIRHSNQQLSALITITTILSESLDLMTILREVIRRITAIFHFDATRIYLYDTQRAELRLQASFETHPEYWTQVKKFHPGEGNVGLVAKTGTPVMFEDIQQDPRYTELSHTKTSLKIGFRFFSAFPIKSKQRTYGTIVCAGEQPRRLKPDEIQLITSMANQIGVAVENVQLFEETRARADELSTLYEIATVVNQSLDLELILRAAMHKVLERFAFDAARMYLYDKESKILRLTAQEGFSPHVAVPRTYHMASGVLGRVFKSGEPMYFTDSQTDAQYHRLVLNRRILRAGYRGQFFIPIAVKGSTLGVMSFLSKSVHPISAGEVALIHSIARQVGVALENAELFSEIRRKADELEKINRKLQEANRIKDDFMASMSHELRTPLGAILGYAALLQDGYGGEVNQTQKEALQVVHHNSQMLLKLINNVLTLARIEARKMTLDVTYGPLEETLRHIRAYVRYLAQSETVQSVWKVQSGLPAISTDHFKLEEVLQNLLSNAYKFTSAGTVELRVQNLPLKKEIEFVVADTGIGIPAAEVERIFEKFHQSRQAHTRAFRGVGLGLSIVKNYLDLMKGEIQVHSRPGEGTTFTFTLPYSIAGEETSQPPAP